jgi:hypothetical protein
MNNAFGVGGIEGVGDLNGQRQENFNFKGAACNPVL